MADLPRPRRPEHAPRLPGRVTVYESTDDLLDAVARAVLVNAHRAVAGSGDFHVALSGGSSPMPVYERLMYDPEFRALPWARTHLWIVDERRVPFEDDRSNFGHIREVLVAHSGIPAERVHPIMATRDDADTHLHAQLRGHLSARPPGWRRLDLVLLGMGADAHTASLFPRSPALRADLPGPDHDPATIMGEPPLARLNSGPAVTPPDRVTMTLRCINGADRVAVLAHGAAKAPTLARLVETLDRAGDAPERLPVDELPILGVRPSSGNLEWFLDGASAGPHPGPSARPGAP
ncbi:MAG: 6-phosphogluconolactonase [Planctomyces sp.]|nr:6-phosphogluconolactonase [Planctomyces sp.]MBA4038982.1 6-phosphogluconolactonase [Planctomyces sp.]MBA4120251.1 6-phosphogluconolactonase [Isosphaera sp.]